MRRSRTLLRKPARKSWSKVNDSGKRSTATVITKICVWRARSRPPLRRASHQPLREPELPAKPKAARSGQLIFYRFAAVASALAVAAAVLLRLAPEVSKSSPPAPDLATLALAQSRSTAAFFRADSAGAPSERIDRIASVRSRELRDNRYALWGVR